MEAASESILADIYDGILNWRRMQYYLVSTPGQKYLDKGCISREEYENLHDYLFVPYQNLGGNGTAKKIMDEVNKLPMCSKEDNHDSE